ncbi:TPM domain-containing protein [Corynebacterium matruchotii]|uniref:TPM domain-containing protein n=1 Tax=Corynebacterium matruchotii TaxID=43768 RepID=UPI00288099FF|nr:TPM domain-containing protein [Corynebacterium matruchotii]
MNRRLAFRRFPLLRPAAAVLCAMTVGIGISPFALAGERVFVQAQGTSTATKLSMGVTDQAGRLSQEEIDSINKLAQDYRHKTDGIAYIVFVDSFPPGMDAQEWATQALKPIAASRYDILLAVGSNTYGYAYSEAFTAKSFKQVDTAVVSHLRQHDWAGAASSFITTAQQVAAGGSSSGDSKGSAAVGAAILLGGLGLLGAAGGGAVYAAKRKSKRDTAKAVEQGRALDPKDTAALSQLSTAALEQLAAEELVSTDESIKAAQAELDISVSEFGTERTRKFTQSLQHSQSTLQKAFAIQQQINDRKYTSEFDKRSLLIEIISSCGQADDVLDQEAKNFADMRNLLVNAPQTLERLTQSTVDLQARITPAMEQMADLRRSFPAETLSSINHNVEIAQAALAEAEKQIDVGRDLAARPAGEQAGLIEAIRIAETDINQADRMLKAIESARSDIAAAQANLDALIAEIEGEIAQGEAIKSQGVAQGTQLDWNAVSNTLTRAREALQEARGIKDHDPLTAWTRLTDMDSQLDEMLEQIQSGITDHARVLRVFDQQSAAAQTAIRAAQDFISSRGRYVRSDARTKLADAEQAFEKAVAVRTSQTRDAINYARHATTQAQAALRVAQRDVDSEMRQNNSSGGSAGSFVAGALFNEMMNDHHRSGFGSYGSSGGGFNIGGGGGSFGGGGGGGGSF